MLKMIDQHSLSSEIQPLEVDCDCHNNTMMTVRTIVLLIADLPTDVVFSLKVEVPTVISF